MNVLVGLVRVMLVVLMTPLLLVTYLVLWVAWPIAPESALVDAFCLAGGPVPERGFCLGRGLACFSKIRLGGPKVRRARARCSDPGDGALVDLYRDRSVAPLVDLRREAEG